MSIDKQPTSATSTSEGSEITKGDALSQARNAGALLKAGIAEFNADKKPAAQLLLGAAESLFKNAGDPWNASVARQWLNTLKTDAFNV
ncbi:MAG TPA: hypothetical protein VJS42_01260 [Steroidobacteraceae bacterium]|nr:hypothetical protein [Steroidobacteraceae bacterium]